MKKMIIFIMIINLFAGVETAIIKNLSRFFSKESLNIVTKRYGDDGIKALNNLSAKYGRNGLTKLETISANYGKNGIKLVAKYGEVVVKNPTFFQIVNKFKDKGFYIIERFPKKSVEYYKKFGDKFIILSDKFGTKRIINYLNEAEKRGAGEKVLKFIEKFGANGVQFLEKHWGKLLVSGFVLLNADSLIKSSENIINNGIKTTGEVTTKTISNIANSNFGILAGIALILFVFLKYGFEKLFRKKKDKL